MPVSFGDFVMLALCASGGGANMATVHFGNITSGIGTSYVISAPNLTTLVGNSAEWIVEAPTLSGVQIPLADYGEVFFSTCVAGLSGGGGVGGGTGKKLDLGTPGAVTSRGTLIAENIIQCQYITL